MSFAVAGALGVFGAVALLWPTLLLPPASADMGQACLDAHQPGEDDYGQVEGIESDGASADQLRGVRSDVWVVNGAACQRISSVIILSPSFNGHFEFGYFRGWIQGCEGTAHFDRPTVFAHWNPNTGSTGCRVFEAQHPSDNQTHLFRASDVNADRLWGGWLDGDELQPNGVELDFTRGWGVINTERGHPNDSGSAEFSNIEEYHDSNGWTYTNGLQPYYDRDPDYHLRVVNSHHGEVVQ